MPLSCPQYTGDGIALWAGVKYAASALLSKYQQLHDKMQVFAGTLDPMSRQYAKLNDLYPRLQKAGDDFQGYYDATAANIDNDLSLFSCDDPDWMAKWGPISWTIAAVSNQTDALSAIYQASASSYFLAGGT